MNWDAPYVVPDSLVLRLSPSGALVAASALSAEPHELGEEALPVLTAFAAPATPRAALAKLRESWEIDEGGFETSVDALLRAKLLTPTGPSAQRDLHLILGLNRSGTSALTKALAACGVAVD